MKKTTILILCTLLAFFFVSCAPDSTPTPATPTLPPTGQVEMTEDEKAQAFINIQKVYEPIKESFSSISSAISNNTPTEIDETDDLDNDALLDVVKFGLDNRANAITESTIKSGKVTKTEDYASWPKASILKIENTEISVTYTAEGVTDELTKTLNLSFNGSFTTEETMEFKISISFNINGKDYSITAEGKEASSFSHATVKGKEIDVNVLNSLIKGPTA